MSGLELFLVAIGLYAVAGVIFALAFVIGGIARVDAATAASPKSVRLLLFPGIAGLWPLMLAKWIGSSRTTGEATDHASGGEST